MNLQHLKAIQRSKLMKGVPFLLVEGVLPSSRVMGMCRWMGSHFHDWIDYYGVAFFVRVTIIGSFIFRILEVRKFRYVGI